MSRTVPRDAMGARYTEAMIQFKLGMKTAAMLLESSENVIWSDGVREEWR